jgi:hypothetical protein
MSLIMGNKNKAELLQHLTVTKFDIANRLKTPAEQVARYVHHSIMWTKNQKKFEHYLYAIFILQIG